MVRAHVLPPESAADGTLRSKRRSSFRFHRRFSRVLNSWLTPTILGCGGMGAGPAKSGRRISTRSENARETLGVKITATSIDPDTRSGAIQAHFRATMPNLNIYSPSRVRSYALNSGANA